MMYSNLSVYFYYRRLKQLIKKTPFEDTKLFKHNQNSNGGWRQFLVVTNQFLIWKIVITVLRGLNEKKV